MLDISIGGGAIMRLNVWKYDEHRKWYVMRIVEVYRDEGKAEALGDPKMKDVKYEPGTIV